jgi:hypothetical protein
MNVMTADLNPACGKYEAETPTLSVKEEELDTG